MNKKIFYGIILSLSVIVLVPLTVYAVPSVSVDDPHIQRESAVTRIELDELVVGDFEIISESKGVLWGDIQGVSKAVFYGDKLCYIPPSQQTLLLVFAKPSLVVSERGICEGSGKENNIILRGGESTVFQKGSKLLLIGVGISDDNKWFELKSTDPVRIFDVSLNKEVYSHGDTLTITALGLQKDHVAFMNVLNGTNHTIFQIDQVVRKDGRVSQNFTVPQFLSDGRYSIELFTNEHKDAITNFFLVRN